MLYIRENVIRQIAEDFSSNSQERGFLLGCGSRLDVLDYCCPISAVQAGKYFFAPDAHAADIIIRNWAAEGVCFCGFIHSHVVSKVDLSEADVEFANMILGSFRLPLIWFGLGVCKNQKVEFQFYKISRNGINLEEMKLC